MNPFEDSLKFLQLGDWSGLNKLFSKERSVSSLAESPYFSIFERNLVDALKQSESKGAPSFLTFAAKIFNLHESVNSSFKLSQEVVQELALFLFERHPTEKYAQILKRNSSAQEYLLKRSLNHKSKIEQSLIGANLNVKIGSTGDATFSKSIFNSPQEKELYLAAIEVFPEAIMLPNVALSTIIDSKICKLLDSSSTNFFFKATLDLCIVCSSSYMPLYYVELDSSYHDNPRQIENDKRKDLIFEKSGLPLSRLRKRRNLNQTEVFKLFFEDLKRSQSK